MEQHFYLTYFENLLFLFYLCFMKFNLPQICLLCLQKSYHNPYTIIYPSFIITVSLYKINKSQRSFLNELMAMAQTPTTL